MRVIVSGGGTGGHIYPAIALIKRLRERNLLDAVLYVGTEEGLEKQIVKRENIPFESIEIQGFKRKLTLENFKTVWLFMKSISKGKKIVRDFKPDVVVGTGGYVSSSIVYAAHRLGVPTVIHEQNSVAGLTNKFLGRFVDKIAYAFDDVVDQFPEKSKLVFTGNPRAQEVAGLKHNDRLDEFDLKPNVPTVMIFGGSRGAAPINRVTVQSIDDFADEPYQVLFVTGKVHYDDVEEQLETKKMPDNVKVVSYIDDMPNILPDIELIVGRSGATSIAELNSLGVPAIFIPSPYVTHDHQTVNAMSLVNRGAAVMIKEANLTSNKLVDTIDDIMKDDKKRETMAANSKKLGVRDASDRLIKVMQDIAK